MSDNKGVLVYAELADGALSSVVAELLTAGRQLAQALGEELSAVVVGSGAATHAQEVIRLGADKAYVVDNPLLKAYQQEAYLAALEAAAKQAKPNVFLLARTLQGRDLGPRLAFRLNTGLAQDCVEISVDPASKRVEAVRPVYGGNAHARVTWGDSRPQMATIRPKTFEPAHPAASRQGQTVPVSVHIEASMMKTRVMEKVKEQATGVKLEDAKVVIGGGRGLGGPDPFFKELAELAKLFNGAVGASRAAVDAGWVPSSMQIGLTGKTITPDLYITFAISGASQHMAGCSGAKVIVAINKDADSAIFKEARYGIVGDWKQVLPAFTQKVRELLKS